MQVVDLNYKVDCLQQLHLQAAIIMLVTPVESKNGIVAMTYSMCVKNIPLDVMFEGRFS